ncbi:hypothetical protein D1007_19781 [Hordeum vulgare]|nr:hypothetical protein D1007_19781 [Hordeum vulgare]
MQAAWKAWPHWGSTRMASPSSNSARQMAHSGAAAASSFPLPLPAPASAETYATVGMARSTDFLTPRLAAARALASAPPHAHQRATRPMPRTVMSAQSSAARMMTMSRSSAMIRAPGVDTPSAAACRSLLATMGVRCCSCVVMSVVSVRVWWGGSEAGVAGSWMRCGEEGDKCVLEASEGVARSEWPEDFIGGVGGFFLSFSGSGVRIKPRGVSGRGG